MLPILKVTAAGGATGTSTVCSFDRLVPDAFIAFTRYMILEPAETFASLKVVPVVVPRLNQLVVPAPLRSTSYDVALADAVQLKLTSA